MAGNLLLLQQVSSGATVSAGHTTIGIDTNARPYATDTGGVVLYATYTQTIKVTNTTGNTTLAFSPNANKMEGVVTLAGSARTSIIVLEITGRLSDDRGTLRINVPATAGIIFDITNATSGGTSLIGGPQTTTGGAGQSLLLEYYFDGAAMQILGLIYPTL